MNKFFSKLSMLSLLFAALIFCLNACTPAPPENCRDELLSHKWILYNQSNVKKGSLIFNDDYMTMNVETGENSNFEFNEKFLCDTQKITISSKNYGTVQFNYKIDGEKLYLSYLGKKITFKKE